MFKTNLKIAWRNLLNDRQFTIINVVGLAAGLTCAMLIVLWVNDERNVDKIFAEDDRLYQLMEYRAGNETEFTPQSSGLLADAVAEDVVGVKYAAAVAPADWFPSYTLSANDKNIKASGQYVGKDYFNIFSFNLVEGNPDLMLKDKSSIVISDELAIKLFGSKTGLQGKALRFDQDTTFFISGVFEKMPAQSSQQFDFVLSFDYFKSIKEWVNLWDHSGPSTYVMLDKNIALSTFNKNLSNIITERTGNPSRKVKATRFSRQYLYGIAGGSAGEGRRIQFVRLFSLLALFILVVACINFMNLSTAKVSRRLKEIGIKKVVGARRWQLIFQFLSESMLLTLFAGLVALLLVALLLPVFNQITAKQIQLQLNAELLLYLSGIIVVTGLLAGSYPAIYLSKSKPLGVLKGQTAHSLAELLSRKGLVVFQFSISAILLVSVLVIYQQMRFINNKDAGYNKNSIVRFSVEGAIKGKEDVFLAELKKIDAIENASTTYHKMVGRGYSHGGMDWPGKEPDANLHFEVFEVGYDFPETMGMEIIKGRSFAQNYGNDSMNIVLNETAVKEMHLSEPVVGTTIRRFGRDVQVIGVMKDFHFESMHEPIRPGYLFLYGGNTVVASVKPAKMKEALVSIEQLYRKFNPGFPFTYNFLDEAYQKQYESETRISTLSKYFAGLAILISCLGLFGLAAFTAQKRRKEIGVRKVVGASVSSIAGLLSKDYVRLVLIALMIAFPISWWIMSQWLQGFAYRVGIGPQVYLIVGLSMLVLTLLTVSYQSIKAALVSPSKSLKTE